MERTFTKDEILRIARTYFAGLPVDEDLPQGLLFDLKSFGKHFKGIIPETYQADAFLFFASELGWSAEEFRKKRKELTEKAASCRRHRGPCLTPQSYRKSWAMCWVCPKFQDTPTEADGLLSDEFLDDWYRALERKAWKEMSPRLRAMHLELERLKAEARKETGSPFPEPTVIRGDEDEVADSLAVARTNRR